MGIERLTLYAFSTENWKRPQPEVNFLMELFKDYLLRQLRDLMKDGVQLHVVGERNGCLKDSGRKSKPVRRIRRTIRD